MKLHVIFDTKLITADLFRDPGKIPVEYDEAVYKTSGGDLVSLPVEENGLVKISRKYRVQNFISNETLNKLIKEMENNTNE